MRSDKSARHNHSFQPQTFEYLWTEFHRKFWKQ